MKQLFILIVLVLAVQAKADNYRDMEPLTLETPEMKAELVDLPERTSILLDMAAPAASPKMDFDFFKSKTNPGVKSASLCSWQAWPSRATRPCSGSMPRQIREANVIRNS